MNLNIRTMDNEVYDFASVSAETIQIATRKTAQGKGLVMDTPAGKSIAFAPGTIMRAETHE